MVKPFIAGRMMVKNLDTGRLRSAAELEYVLKRSQQHLLRKIRQKISKYQFSPRAKKAFSAALKVEVKPKSLVVTSDHPGFRYYIEGRKNKQMKWLEGTHSIPIVTKEGKLIFRNATSRSMKSAGGGPNAGKPGWVHPGRKPATFVEIAKQEARQFLNERLRQEIKDKIRTAIRRR